MTTPESNASRPEIPVSSANPEGGLPHVDVTDLHNIHELHAPIIREQREPRDGMEPVPPWLTVFFGALIFWGGYYMARFSGDFRADIYDENAVHYGKITTGNAVEEDPLAAGKRLYTIHCGGCHQQSGKGEAGKFPPLAGSSWVTGPLPILARIPLNGLQGPISVDGVKYDGNMPAFGPRLQDAEIASILSYIRQSWGNSADAVSPEMISAIREEVASRSTAWTEAELQSVSPKLPELPDSRTPEDGEKSSKKTESLGERVDVENKADREKAE